MMKVSTYDIQYPISDPPSTSLNKNAFTIVELLAVVLIIGILAAMILGFAGVATKKSDEAKAKALFSKIQMGLETFYSRNKHYPYVTCWSGDSTVLFNTLFNNGNDPYMDLDQSTIQDQRFVDPWGSDIYYRTIIPGNAGTINNAGEYDLLILGQDRSNGTSDDLDNW